MKTKITENKIVKNIFNIILSLISITLYIVPNTIINSGFVYVGMLVFIIFAIIYLLKRFISKKIIIFEKDKSYYFELIINSLSLGIFITLIFFLILNIFPKEITYIYTFGNYHVYNLVPNIIYILNTSLLLPLVYNLLVRKNIDKLSSKKSKIICSIFLGIITFITSSTYISGIYLMIVSIILSLFYIKNNSLKETFIIECILGLTLSLITLYFSEFKILITIFIVLINLGTFFINIRKIENKKEL